LPVRRILLTVAFVLVVLAAGGGYFFNQYWIHRFDDIIERQAAIYRLDPKLVWSVIYQETYFRPWMTGEAGEVGLMQIMPNTAREWASETGLQDLEKQISDNHAAVLSEPERNIQIGCWYLEKLRERFRDTPAPEARALAAYNAGASRVLEWDKSAEKSAPPNEEEFVRRIDIPSTRNYVSEILGRYRKLKK
jgi:soluble lytic murein transglycosylase